MRKPLFRLASVVGGLALSLTAGPATAQWFPAGDPCNACPPAACAPQCGPVCQTAVPVAQTCYQTVPVTEYREVQQTVQKPVYETAWVDQQVTEYRPVTETRTAQVPTLTYENVTEYRTVSRDMGCWQTSYQCNQKVAPCAYDPRPGFMGWLNRTSYSMRSAMTPAVTANRQWIPNVVTAQVPVTRRVAQHGTREVAYNVTRLEPHTTTRKVAVNKVRYETQVVSRKVPVTTYRTVPTGTMTAWVTPYGTTATAFTPLTNSATAALQPKADPAATARAQDITIPSRSADADANKYERNGRDDRFSQPPAASSPGMFRRDGGSSPDAPRRDAGKAPPSFQPSSYEEYQSPQSEPRLLPTGPDARIEPQQTHGGFRPTNKFRAANAPSMVRSSRPAASPPVRGPQSAGPSVAAADGGR